MVQIKGEYCNQYGNQCCYYWVIEEFCYWQESVIFWQDYFGNCMYCYQYYWYQRGLDVDVKVWYFFFVEGFCVVEIFWNWFIDIF